MRRLLNVERTLQLFFEAEGAEEDTEPESEPESEDSDGEVDHLSFVVKEETEEEECTLGATRRSAQREGRGGGSARSRSPPARAAEPQLSSEPWRTEEDADSVPALSRFKPRRTPGVQVETLFPHNPKDLFLLFFATDTVKTICSNTNKNAAKNKELGEIYSWTDIETEDLYRFFGLLIYMSLVSLPSLQDYWRENHILSVTLPAQVMTRDRFQSIFWNIHLCDPEEDQQHDRKKGAGCDKLFGVRPLYDDILSACQAYYHPRRELRVDERMVATKAKTSMYMKDKQTKWGMNFFVLAESSSGYTFRFSIYTGKTVTASEHGRSYDVVMSLIQPSCLGTGYHIYMDSFYTSPKLFMDLASMTFGACGTYRESRKGCPRGKANALTKKCGRGSVRWIREGPLVFVKWMDTREVSVCSSIHPAFSGETVQRRVKSGYERWAVRDIPCPTPILAYNRYMGGVGLSDQLSQSYSTHRNTARWYRTMLMHFLDIATTNAFIMHCEMSSAEQVQPIAPKDFMLELVCQLCDVDQEVVPESMTADHVPVPIVTAADASQRATKGRLKCRRCFQVDNRRRDTPWKCQACDVTDSNVIRFHLEVLYGISVKSFERRKERPFICGAKIFGVSLENLPRRYIPEFGLVPCFLVDACSALLERAGTVGLFRKPGSLPRIKTLRAKLNSGEGCLSTALPYDVATLIKQFCRELPEPLFPSELHAALLKAQALPGLQDRTSALQLLSCLLPARNSSCLHYLFDFLCKVSQRCSENLMTSSNLATVFAPCLLPPPNKVEMSEGRLELRVLVLRTFIENPHLFVQSVSWIQGRSKVRSPVADQKHKSTSGDRRLSRSLGLESLPNVLLFRACVPCSDQRPAAALLDNSSRVGKEACETPQDRPKRDLRLGHLSRFSRGPDAGSSPVLTGVGKLQLTPWRRRVSL
ncbi:hypothetical protein L3Q82_001286 [Scortum barcoo]|uniref:Uncharacterized protein n=1 Tax=Scortum barcoo TaxID=214431 RepID=A0ACB8W730_9TELE|nr:hypothetical protein L3Q82_001286 [Scortum barcoo]